MSTNGLKTKHSREGSALLILLLLILVIAGVFTWTSLKGSNAESGMTQDAQTGLGVEPTPPADLAPLQDDGLTPSSRVEVGPLPYRRMKRTFDGKGQISGELLPSGTGPMPEKWTLVIEPSEFAVGRETAIRRELEFPGQQTTFEVRDLPMASYRVFARAKDQASVALEVSLFKIEGPGQRVKDRSHVMLRLQPLSSLQVSLRNEDLSPALDLPLILESKITRKRWTAKTDAAGVHTFEELPAGTLTLLVGHADQPLIPAQAIQIETGKLATWTGTLPKTHEVTLRVIDREGMPLPDAIVRGHGGVPIDGVADFTGELTLRYLPAGTYRLRVEHKPSERHGRTTLVIPLSEGQPHPYPIYCRR